MHESATETVLVPLLVCLVSRMLFFTLISVRAAFLSEWSLVITEKTCRPLRKLERGR